MKINHLLIISLCLGCINAYSQEEEDVVVRKEKSFEIYGHVMLDAGYNFNQSDPSWYDVSRPTKLPSFADQYGTDGNVYFSVRQTRLGVNGYLPTPLGELKTKFEFELFGTGVNAGQTTFRLRHAYGEIGKFGAGQTWSPFMDIDVFPNSLEYWGPNGMVFYRNIQIRYMPIQGETRMTIALEAPGGSSDQGNYSDRIELADVKPRFYLPDLSAEYRQGGRWGYVELAGILRQVKWEDMGNQPYDLSGSAVGWGLNLSTNLKFGNNQSTVFRGQVVYGRGIENYMNDAPADIGIQNQFSNTQKPIKGVPIPVLGIVAFLDHNWNNKFSSSIGYSMVQIDNTDGQQASAFKRGQYALTNLLYTPVQNLTGGLELQWAMRDNNSDGWNSTGTKVQLSFKFNFSQAFYRNITQDQ